jgi:predicted DsbA family dithiol-disulfide isomerase
LNQYYFVDGHSLNDRPLLARAVAEALSSMMEDAPSARELLDFLDGDQGRKEIEAALRALDQLGVHSIPKFIIEGRTLLDGAAHSDSFIQIFREIEARGKVHTGTKFADILGIPPKIVEQGSHHRPSNIAA